MALDGASKMEKSLDVAQCAWIIDSSMKASTDGNPTTNVSN
jgi:hypothetical protein